MTGSASAPWESEPEQGPEPERVYNLIHTGLEELEDYSVGGYHPIDINDLVLDGHYKIVHKLGHGAFSTVWLARDQQQQRYVSLKFSMADASEESSEGQVLRYLQDASNPTCAAHPGRQFVLKLLDEFEVEGPNGRLRCIVTDVLGPSIRWMKEEASEDGLLPLNIVRKVASQVAKGIAYLQACRVVHGAGKKTPITRTDGQPTGPAAPKYAVTSVNPRNLRPFCLTSDCSVEIADFGESFILPADTESIPKTLGTPVGIAAPEIYLEGEEAVVGLPVDIWSLAYTMYEIFSNHHLLESTSGDPNEVLEEMVRTFGKFPEKWWDLWGEHREKVFEDDGSFKVGSEWLTGEDLTVDLRARIEQLVIAPNSGGQYLPVKVLEDDEIVALEKLLAAMLKYEPKERIGGEEGLNMLPIQWRAAERCQNDVS
ncbi:hypothetical protein RUND412_010637 [Rhizina undulata]